MLEVFILSYNRGRYLLNCFNSVKRCIQDSKIIILDDNSDDLNTIKTLTEIITLGGNVVFSAFDKVKSNSKVGGLHFNMNEILTKLNHSDFILILEDDMQMVREVGPKEVKDLFDYFDAHKNSLTLHVNFFKEKETLDYHYMIDETNRYYFIIDEFEPKYVNFTYPGVWNTKLIKESGLVLSENMDFNREFIRKNYSKMFYYAFPFMMYLPFPSSIKFQQTSITRTIIEKLNGFGFYPYDFINIEILNNLLMRDLKTLPYIHDYLKKKFPKKELIPYYGDALYRQPVIIWRIYRTEILVRKYLKKIFSTHKKSY